MAAIEDRVYVGASPHQALLIRGPVAEIELWLRGIDGRWDWGEQVDSAVRFGIDPDDAQRVLAQLESSGLAVRRESGVGIGARMVVIGDDESSLELVGMLKARGLTSTALAMPRVGPDLPDTADAARQVDYLMRGCRGADLAIVFLRRGVPDAGELAVADRLLADEIPQLAMAPGRTRRIGPLVVPGSGACLRCEHLAMVDVNPDWSKIVQEWAWRSPPPPDRIDLELAAADLAGFLAEGLEPLTSEVLERTWPGSRWRQRTLRRHPGCGCWWPGGLSPVGPPTFDW